MNEHSTQAAKFPTRYPYRYTLMITTACFIIFSMLTSVYVTWSIHNSNHRWCQIFQLLEEAPALKLAPDSPSRTYDAKLAQDFRDLVRNSGCP